MTMQEQLPLSPTTTPAQRSWRLLGMALLMVLLQACAATVPKTSGDPRDPLESVNRQVTAFNDSVDGMVLKPVAKTYALVVPGLVRTGVRNFFGNLGDVWSLANNAAQFKFRATGDTALRIGMNTFLGMGGLFDIATDYGIEKHKSDFGLTLAHWGVPPGPYVVLPLLGPSTLRDAAALPVDFQGDLSRQSASSQKRDATLALKLTDTREGLLKLVDAVKEASLDPYTFTRDAYLQKRRYDLYDGNPPAQPKGDDSEDDLGR
jgi:phospholipid-binding lipoprotein MlaA